MKKPVLLACTIVAAVIAKSQLSCCRKIRNRWLVRIRGGPSLNSRSGSAELVAVKHPTESGGYTPGDTWELHVGKDNRAEYFVFHRGRGQEAELSLRNVEATTKRLVLWSSQSPRLRSMPIVFFTDVAVKVTGSNAWMKAQ